MTSATATEADTVAKMEQQATSAVVVSEPTRSPDDVDVDDDDDDDEKVVKRSGSGNESGKSDTRVKKTEEPAAAAKGCGCVVS